AELDSGQAAGGVARLLADEHLTPSGRRAEPRRDVDRAPVPLALSLYRRAGVDAHPDQREAGDRLELLDDPDSERYPGPGLLAAKQQPIAERLQLLGSMGGKEPTYPLVQGERHLGRPVIALGVGQRGEADQVGEEEGVVE